VVEEANPSNPAGIAHALAAVIGWTQDDASAAYRWRLDQARVCIRSVEPELVRLGVFQVAAPFYVRDPAKGPKDQGYVPLMSLKTSEEVAADTLEAEIRRAVGALERAYSVAVALGREEDAAMLHGALAIMGRAPAAVASDTSESQQASL